LYQKAGDIPQVIKNFAKMTNSIKKIRIENTQDFVGEKIRVFKSDFEIYEHFSGYYSISLKDSHGGNNVWGGDSAWEDCYDKKLAQAIFSEWDGTLYYDSNYGYGINE